MHTAKLNCIFRQKSALLYNFDSNFNGVAEPLMNCGNYFEIRRTRYNNRKGTALDESI